jgi:hypothetical protein
MQALQNKTGNVTIYLPYDSTIALLPINPGAKKSYIHIKILNGNV